MRLKKIDRPLAVRNCNSDILNSPKQINTSQNSNVSTTNHTDSTVNFSNFTGNFNDSTENFINSTERFANYALTCCSYNSINTINNVITELQQSGDFNLLKNVVEDKVQCYQASLQEAQKNANNCRRNSVNVNIHNTLATTFRHRQRQAVALTPPRKSSTNSVCSVQSTPGADDTFVDFEEAQQSYSSADISPQDENRYFDISESESSEDGNLNNGDTVQRKARGFQHLAHALTTDAECTDANLDFEAPTITVLLSNSLSTVQEAEANNNNNHIDTDYKIDSVNRLDSAENIQKVFHDKPVFNVEEDSEFNQNSDSCSSHSNRSDEDGDVHANLNIRIEDRAIAIENIVDNFRIEVEAELEKVTYQHEEIFEDLRHLPKIEKATVQELKEPVEKLHVIKAAIKYNIEPNIEQPFNKLSPVKNVPLHQVLEDTEIIKKLLPGDIIVNETSIKLNLTNTPSATSNVSPSFEESTTAPLSICLKNCRTAVIRKILVDSETPFIDLDLIPENNKPATPFLIQDQSQNENVNKMEDSLEIKIEDAFLSNAKENISVSGYDEDVLRDTNLNLQDSEMEVEIYRKKNDFNRELEELECQIKKIKYDTRLSENEVGKFCEKDITNDYREKDDDSSKLRKKEKRRTDREEIRRRLAMGSEDDYYSDRPGRKPSLQSRLQSGMNLQICFMNESLSDTDSPSSDSECPMTNPKHHKLNNNSLKSPHKIENSLVVPPTRPVTLSLGQQPSSQMIIREPLNEMDFFTRQARLQTEARMALAQAKEMARMQMEIEKQRQKKSPITEMIRTSMEKVGIPFPEDKRRLSRQILTDMNVAQLQVIVNDLHTQIEVLNEGLVKFLMARDDLHMGQDSMLVDIEDLTRYLGAKEQVLKEQNIAPTRNNNTPPSPAPSSPMQALNSTVKPHLHRIANLVKK